MTLWQDRRVAERNNKVIKSSRASARDDKAKPVAVVGIGVCAASLESLLTLFRDLDDLGAAYVIAVRQQDGLTVDTVLQALSDVTGLEVRLGKDGAPLEPGVIHVGGGSELITVVDGSIAVRGTEQQPAFRGTVDSLLISLAEHARDRSVAVILNSLGSDGTAGVTATKQFGGLAIAECLSGDEEAAAEQGAATPAGIVDLLLPIEQIAPQIALYVSGLETVGTTDQAEEISEHVGEVLTQIAGTLRTVTGNDFHGYKRNTFLRRVQRRMQVVQVGDIDQYAARLKKDRDEVQHLFQDLLIGVTQFFRDPAEFQALEKEIPKLFEGKGPQDQVRVWVLGCATGEEAYSIGILLAEHLGTVDNGPTVQIFATDLDARALGAGRAGRYSSAIADHVTPERLARWFVKEGDTYRVVKELREMCIFSPHNLIKDAPFSRIDLLSCRNLLIYLNADLQNRVIPIFHFSLRPGGILLLGASENVTRHQKLFAPVDRHNRLFRRLETPTKILPEFPLTARTSRVDTVSERVQPPLRSTALAVSVGRRAEQIAEGYGPAYVIIDTQYEVLHFSGRTGKYLEPASGAASLNLFNLVHRDLRLDLRALLHQATEERAKVAHRRIPVRNDGTSSLVSLFIEPISESNDITALVVLFQDAGEIVETGANEQRKGAGDDHVERLDAELRLTKDRLQATIEELESTNEELKSSNEEYQSINEELQSSNEELETSKEELQSVNEELHTVNAELDHRVRDLAKANSDLRNLLESTQIATIFLDNDLRVRSFTPAATEIFHLLDTDVGRPIDHLGSRVSYPDLSDDVRKVLTKLGTVEREVTSRDGSHYISRVHPYRSVDNFIAGAVLTFLDVTSTVRAEAALRDSESRLRTLLAELQHRVRNTLALVKSITTRTADASESVDEMAAHLTGRLDAFARVQSAVTRNPEAGVDLMSLLSDELLAHAAHEGEEFTAKGPAVALQPKAAESMSLALHELTTNAVKHGALHGRNGGRIAVRWSYAGTDGNRHLDFEWLERGVDGASIDPEREGFGMELLKRILPYDLGAKTDVDFAADGLKFAMQLPINHVIDADLARES
ncbi:MAG TPA: CheR family methyltransferase [Sphingomicrobium sp.]